MIHASRPVGRRILAPEGANLSYRRINFRTWIILVTVLSCAPPKFALGQTARIEIHSFKTTTLTNQEFLTGVKNGKTAEISGELRFPRSANPIWFLGPEKFPAVVLIHGSGGAINVDRWAQELNKIGVAAFIVDSFTGRGIVQTVTDQSQLPTLSMIIDAYRARALLAAHTRIDTSRIALMGFSKGGDVALHASLERFQRLHDSPNAGFAAYIGFYTPCDTKYIDDEQVSDRPIRLFHGASDDFVPVEPCAEYVKRLQSLKKDISLTTYEGARHAFDVSSFPPVQQIPSALKLAAHCRRREEANGVIVNSETGKPFTAADPCVQRGASVGYHSKATDAATKAVKEFLTALWRL
jgi:dienelactone hydrolase